MEIIFKIKNDLGEFTSEPLEVSEEQYINFIEVSKTFYNGTYQMNTPDGFVVIPPDILSKSVLIVEKVK